MTPAQAAGKFICERHFGYGMLLGGRKLHLSIKAIPRKHRVYEKNGERTEDGEFFLFQKRYQIF